MAPYDSDSSDDEEGDYIETNVLLGYAAKEPGDDTISHIGGSPTWLDPATPPCASLAKCKVCDDIMVLLLELNGDLPDSFPEHERRLYIWTCRRKACRRREGSIRALRATRMTGVASSENKHEKKPSPKAKDRAPGPAVNIGETLFGAKPSSMSSSANPFSTATSSANSANPFSPSPSKSQPQNPFTAAGLPSPSELGAKPPQPPTSTTPPTTSDLPKTFASVLSLDSASPQLTFGPPRPAEPWPEISSLPPTYPLLYLVDADYEVLEKIEDLPIPTTTMDVDEPGSSKGGNQKEDKDVFESSIDKTFQKFADRLAQNPEQVLRYEFKGNPLLYSKHDEVGRLLSSGSRSGNEKVKVSGGSRNGIPRCGNCGRERVFEVQLAPHAIMELESEVEGIDGMDWGTIIVGVCGFDCVPKNVRHGEVGYVEEWAGVQWEELAVKM